MTDPPYLAQHPSPQPWRRPPPAPSKIARLAAERQLGTLIAAREPSNRFSNPGFGVAICGSLLLFSGLVALLDLGALRVPSRLALVVAAVVAVISAVTLAAGPSAAYLYPAAMIYRRRGRITLVRWSKVDRLLLVRAGGDNALTGVLLSFEVVTRDGRRFSIGAVGDGNDPVGEALQGLFRRSGRPIVETSADART